jgi:lipopolysaccharide export system permease protein
MEELMKILNKYIIYSILKTLFTTLILTILILLSVDLFSNFDSYVQNNVPLNQILLITINYIPYAFITVLPPAALFSVTFFLSQMYANNEIIAILSSGISLKTVYKQILILMGLVTIFAFIFNENIVLQSRIKRDNMKNQIFNINYNLDNSNIGLIDSVNNNIIFANSYVEKNKSLFNVIVVQKDDSGNIIERIDAKKAVWSEENKDWQLSSVIQSSLFDTNIEIKEFEFYENPKINLEPNLFRNLSTDLQTMALESAIKYLNVQKKVNLQLWYENISEFLDRLSAPFSAFIMTIIACSIDYKNRKNIFLFSIFNSVIVAVIYYVAKMIFQITSKQALINPYVAIVIPYVIILFVPLVYNKIKSSTSVKNS